MDSDADDDDSISLGNNIADVPTRDNNSEEDDYIDDSNSDSDEGLCGCLFT